MLAFVEKDLRWQRSQCTLLLREWHRSCDPRKQGMLAFAGDAILDSCLYVHWRHRELDLAASHQIGVTRSLGTLEGFATALIARYCDAGTLGRTFQPCVPADNKVVGHPIQAGDTWRCMRQGLSRSCLLAQTTSGQFGLPQVVFVLGEGVEQVRLMAQTTEGMAWVGLVDTNEGMGSARLLAQTAEGMGWVRLLAQTTSDWVGLPVAQGLTKRCSFEQEHLDDRDIESADHGRHRRYPLS